MKIKPSREPGLFNHAFSQLFATSIFYAGAGSTAIFGLKKVTQ